MPARSEQRAERGGAVRVPERDDLPHPGTIRALGGEPGQRRRGDQHPRRAGVEPVGDVRRARVGPDQAGTAAGRPDRVDRDGRAGRVLDEHAGRVAFGQAAPGQPGRCRPHRPGEPRPRRYRAVGGVDEGGPVACPVRDFQDALGQRAVWRAIAHHELVCRRAFPGTDAFHQNLPAWLVQRAGPDVNRDPPGRCRWLAGSHPPLGTGRHRVSGPGATV